MGRVALPLAAPGLAALASLAFPLGAAAESLQPHRAVYDVSLEEAEPSASVVAASGRLVFELSGSSCDGYVVNSRFVTRVADREGRERVTDLRSSTLETLDPAEFTFLNETYVDDVRTDLVRGTAEAMAGGLSVTLTEPEDAEMTLGRAIFPTAHTLLILDAAQAGERVVEARVFDGGDDADTLFDTTTLIGPARTGLAGSTDDERAALAAMPEADAATGWRLVISYFEVGGDSAGEQLPDYELAFTMLQNGVSYDVVFDYGTFSLSGKLSELELMEMPDC